MGAVPTSFDELLEAITDEFAAALYVADLTPDDNFFDFGGDSLSALQIVTRLRKKHDLVLRITDFVTNPTPLAIAELVRSSSEIDASH